MVCVEADISSKGLQTRKYFHENSCDHIAKLIYRIYRPHLSKYVLIFRRVTREGRGKVCPALFQELEESTLILGKNALIVVIYGLNFLFKMQFLRVSRRKNRRFFPAGPFFLVLYMIVYQSALIPRKLPCPKKSLVTRLIVVSFQLITCRKICKHYLLTSN